MMNMTSASQMLFESVRSPPVDGCAAIASVPCWLCGSPWSRAVSVEEWNGASFTGQNRVRCPSSPWVCEPCAWVCSRLSPVPGRPPKEGKTLGGNFRNYSHVFDGAGYRNFSKGEKPGLLAWLRAPRVGSWWAAIADSGQKHVIPWAPINPGARGSLLFEEQIVRLPSDWPIVDAASALLTAGATKEEVLAADYDSRAWSLAGDQISAFESTHGHLRGGAWFALAVWLAQRDEETVQARMLAEKEAKANAKAKQRATRAPGALHRERADARPPRISRSRRKSDAALGSDHGSNSSSSANNGERARVGDIADEGAATQLPVQRSFFGD